MVRRWRGEFTYASGGCDRTWIIGLQVASTPRMEWVEHERKGDARRGRDAERLERRGCLGRAQGARCEDARTVVVVAHRCSDVLGKWTREAQAREARRTAVWSVTAVGESRRKETVELRSTQLGTAPCNNLHTNLLHVPFLPIVRLAREYSLFAR